jgi:carbamoyl-phosphate synthase large subunit
MPKRTDIKSILIIGAGPIIIGQACEFDYSGVQACKALREEGYKVILINSNPATIMTDPATADVTYIEPITWQTVEKIIARERPDAILPTMGGQTALNCALDLWHHGVLDKYQVELIGATPEAIDKAEDRLKFKDAMTKIGLGSARSGIAHSMEEAWGVQKAVGFPTVIRPQLHAGRHRWRHRLQPRRVRSTICKRGLEAVADQRAADRRVADRLEGVRAGGGARPADNCIVVCSIENFDPMGVHTGDSITVAPAQTLTDKEYQLLRDAAIRVLRRIGVDTGGSNVQFGVDPATGRMVVIEMNPRVSRSSALASKATGFPIAKVAAKLAVGYTLDELRNEITGGLIPTSFEPAIDYVVTKIPRFTFEKFAEANNILTTQMKSVGEVMAIGRSFQESLHKAMRGLETGVMGFDPKLDLGARDAQEQLRQRLINPTAERLWYIGDAFRAGMGVDEIHELTAIDPWFLAYIDDLIREEQALVGQPLAALDADWLRRLKRKGFADARLARLLGVDEQAVRDQRHRPGGAAGLQAGRHLRRRVRRQHRLPLLQL